MRCNPSRLGVRAGAWIAIAALSTLALPPMAQGADAYETALAEIMQALETNPNGASPDSLETCRSMLETAKLLRKMGRTDRAIRRLKGCQRLLGLEDYRSQYTPARRLQCFG